LSVYDLYEHYGAASGVKIGDATPPLLNSSEIPAGYHKITPGNYSGQKTRFPRLLLINDTSYTVDLQDYLSKDYPISRFDPQKKSDPVVLIVNTHTTESYVEEDVWYYAPPFSAIRTSDLNKNVALVATELRKTLEEYGVPVIQSTKIHDEPSYRDSYIRSLETINEYIEQYPSIKYVIDVHRDSIIAPNGEKFKPAVKINGADCAQVMMVIGTDDGGAYHPDWRGNLTFAAHMQKKLNDKYPMLARPIYLRDARFNQHATKGSVILEVGSCGNTFAEALYAAELFGQCLAELILENNE
jgi:stage II sporulation protein P